MTSLSASLSTAADLTFPSGTTVQHGVLWHALSDPNPAAPGHTTRYEIEARDQFAPLAIWSAPTSFDPALICEGFGTNQAAQRCEVGIGFSPLAYRVRPCGATGCSATWTYTTEPLRCCANTSQCYAGLAEPPGDCR